MRRPAPRLIGFRPLSVLTMELFNKLFGNLLAFVYHCFDRIVIHGYLSALSRPNRQQQSGAACRAREQNP